LRHTIRPRRLSKTHGEGPGSVRVAGDPGGSRAGGRHRPPTGGTVVVVCMCPVARLAAAGHSGSRSRRDSGRPPSPGRT